MQSLQWNIGALMSVFCCIQTPMVILVLFEFSDSRKKKCLQTQTWVIFFFALFTYGSLFWHFHFKSPYKSLANATLGLETLTDWYWYRVLEDEIERLEDVAFRPSLSTVYLVTTFLKEDTRLGSVGEPLPPDDGSGETEVHDREKTHHPSTKSKKIKWMDKADSRLRQGISIGLATCLNMCASSDVVGFRIMRFALGAVALCDVV